jgi:hypothetical protein
MLDPALASSGCPVRVVRRFLVVLDGANGQYPWTLPAVRRYLRFGHRSFVEEGGTMAGTAAENPVRAAVDRAADEMIYIGPDHPYYPLLADLVSAVGKAWQQGFEQGRRGGHEPNPYTWARQEE